MRTVSVMGARVARHPERLFAKDLLSLARSYLQEILRAKRRAQDDVPQQTTQSDVPATVSLISIEHITQLIPALAALKHNQQKNGAEGQVLILTKPHLPLSETKISHLQALLKGTENTVLLQGHSLFKYPKLMTYIPVRIRAYFLHQQLKKYKVSDFYFAHDVSSDFWNQAIMQAFPTAERICYGDALGLVYSHDYFTQLMYRVINKNKILLHNVLARIKRSMLYPSKRNQLLAHQAILAIPCDPGQDFLNQCTLSIVNQNDFRQGVEELAANIPDFKNQMQDLIATSTKPCYLLILNNFTESKMTTLDNEIALYQEILANHVQKDDIVIIKPHPAQNPDCLKAITQALAQDHVIQIIDKKFAHLPIELAVALVTGCEILSLSYSSISLSYIYNKKITHVLTQQLIDKYFLTEKISWFIESNELYLNMIKALQHWTQDHELLLEQ